MAQRTRTHSILAGTAVALALLCPAAAATAQNPAQSPGMLREAREIDRLLAQAETARLNGNCAQRDALLTQAETRIHYAYNLSEPGRNEYNVRATEARARPCPQRRLDRRPGS